jgi:O6-methylguanine-DNA--protein-cysteine methyltransferase
MRFLNRWRRFSPIDDPAAPFTLPLDLRGTAFQLQVWQALRADPGGRNRSYQSGGADHW